MLRKLLGSLLTVSIAACAVNLGAPSPQPYQVVALPVGADGAAAEVAERITAQGAQIAFVTAERDSAWFAEVAGASGLGLSGPGHTGPRSLAFLTNLELLGDTSIVLLVPSGGRIHMHDALYEVDEDRNLDLMLVDMDGARDLRDGVRTLLQYIASDVGNSVPLMLAVTAPQTMVDDSVAVLLRAAFANARLCAGTAEDGATLPAAEGMALLYGPPAQMQCESARALPGHSGISARLVVGR